MTQRKVYGTTELAERLTALGVPTKPSAISQRRFRQDTLGSKSPRNLPPPTEELASGPVWLSDEIEPWIQSEIERAKVKS